MPKSARATGNRRRAVLGATTMLVFLALSLAALAVRQVASESRDYLDDRARRLGRDIEVALSHLERLEETALDDLARVFADDEADPREVESAHPLIDHAFHVVDGHVTWPPPLQIARYGDELGVGETGTPLASRLLDRAYRLLADGEPERALAAFEQALERNLRPSARAEALLQMATILAADPERRREAGTCFDRVLRLDEGEAGAGTGLLPWRLAARYRKAMLLLDDADPSVGIQELLGFAETISKAGSLSRTGEFAAFYHERSIEALSRLQREGKLSTEDERRLLDVEESVRTTRDRAAFRRELEETWLPALWARVPNEAKVPARIFREGPRLVVFRVETDVASGVVGMRVHLNTYGQRIVDEIGSLGLRSGANPGESVDVRLLDRGGQLLLGEDGSLDESKETWLRSELGADLPWMVAVPVSEDLRRFQLGRSLLYGGLATIVLLVVTIATLTTLRGMQRAVELADLKSEFVANVSHELKTPLTLIRMFTDLLLLGYTKDPGETRENLKLIARETENLSLLIDNVLDLSRIDAGEKQYHPAPADLPALIRQAVDHYRPYLERKGFTVEMDLPGDFPPIEIDQTAFARALGNLLSNSVKYSGDRKEVEVRLRLDETRALVEVSDRGVGLRPEDAARVFDRFFRGTADATSLPEPARAGTGIGLAIVKHIVESHGGEVYAAPREGGGSRFTMEFPVNGSGETGEGRGRDV